MWKLILIIGTCSALLVKEHWRHVSTNGIELRRGIYGIGIQKETLWTIAPMATTSEPGRIIDLSNLNIKELRNNVFNYLANVTILDLSNNKLESLPPLIFTKLKTLQTLSLSNNKLRTFDRCFIGLRNLKSLDLSYNLIEFLTSGDLFGLPKVVVLTTTGNPIVKFSIDPRDSSLPYYVPSKFDRNPWNGLDRSDMEPVVKLLEDSMNAPADSLYALAWSPYSSQPFYMKLCESNDGVVDSLHIATEEDLETCQTIIPPGQSLTLNLENREIKNFHSKWYRITKNFFEAINLSSNNIIISPKIFQNLPNSIVSVELEQNKISRIQRNAIQNGFLKKISFAFNEIRFIENKAFKGTNLVSLSFAYNHLLDNLNFTETLPNSIEELVLTGNGISAIPENFLTKLIVLKHLVLENNYISHLSANMFRGLKKLRTINLSVNWIEGIEPGTFENQEELSIINLFSNSMKNINPEIFKGLKMLTSLSLKKNFIKNISRHTFDELRFLVMQAMDLSDNEIGAIEEGSFSYMTIEYLDIRVNNISDKSVEKGAFELCSIYDLFYDSNPLKNIDGDGFNDLLLYKLNRFFF